MMVPIGKYNKSFIEKENKRTKGLDALNENEK